MKNVTALDQARRKRQARADRGAAAAEDNAAMLAQLKAMTDQERAQVLRNLTNLGEGAFPQEVSDGFVALVLEASLPACIWEALGEHWQPHR